MPPIKSKDPIGQYHFTKKNSALIFVIIGTTSFVDIDNCLLIAMLTTDVQETAIEVPALGRDFELESFYNICTDKIRYSYLERSGDGTTREVEILQIPKTAFCLELPRDYLPNVHASRVCFGMGILLFFVLSLYTILILDILVSCRHFSSIIGRIFT